MRISLFIVILFACFGACKKKEEQTSPADFNINASNSISIEYLQELIDRRPDNVNNFIRLARIYYDANDLDLAIETMQNALEENPENSKARLLLASYYLEKDNPERAREYFEKLNDQDESVDYSIVQAELLIDKGFYDKALQVLNRSINKDAGNARLYYLKGRALEKISDTLPALASFKTAVSLENVKFSMVVDYLDILAALGRSREFFDSYNDLSPRLKAEPELRLIFANMLINEQNADSAKTILYGIDHKDFLNSKYLKLGEIHYDQYRYDSARYYAELSYNHSEDLAAKLLIARSYDKMYNYTEAENAYQEIVEVDSTYTIAIEELEKLRRKIRYLRELKRKEEQRKIPLVPLKPLTPEN